MHQAVRSIEALILPEIGNTKPSAGELTFADALKRSFHVGALGAGLGIPTVAVLANYASYRRLIRTGKTSWDAENHFVVAHERVGAVRVVVAGAIVASATISAVIIYTA